MNKHGNFSKLKKLKKINITWSFIQILQLRQSILLEWRNIINKESIKKNNIQQKLQINLCGTLKPITKILCKDYYWHIINKAKHETNAKTKWSDIYNEFKEVDNCFIVWSPDIRWYTEYTTKDLQSFLVINLILWICLR